MMTIYLREAKYIIANFSLNKRATGYRINSKYATSIAIKEMLRLKWIKCVEINDKFMFVMPTKKLLGMGFKTNSRLNEQSVQYTKKGKVNFSRSICSTLLAFAITTLEAKAQQLLFQKNPGTIFYVMNNPGNKEVSVFGYSGAFVGARDSAYNKGVNEIKLSITKIRGVYFILLETEGHSYKSEIPVY